MDLCGLFVFSQALSILSTLLAWHVARSLLIAKTCSNCQFELSSTCQWLSIHMWGPLSASEIVLQERLAKIFNGKIIGNRQFGKGFLSNSLLNIEEETGRETSQFTLLPHPVVRSIQASRLTFLIFNYWFCVIGDSASHQHVEASLDSHLRKTNKSYFNTKLKTISESESANLTWGYS